MTESTSTPDELATRVWSAMQTFVTVHDRRRQLQEVIGLGWGKGRVKLLLQLRDGPLTLSEIAEANGVDAPYATIIVDKLASLGYVERTAHPDDHRRKLVQLTNTGQEAAKLAGRIIAEPPLALATLAPKDLEDLEKVMRRLVQPKT